jgi:hypothetical protein
MGVPRYKKQRDTSEPGICDALEAVGAQVWPTDWVDLIVAFRGRWFLLECKTPGKGTKPATLARQQEHRDRAASCGCVIEIVETPDDAVRAIGAVK